MPALFSRREVIISTWTCRYLLLVQGLCHVERIRWRGLHVAQQILQAAFDERELDDLSGDAKRDRFGLAEEDEDEDELHHHSNGRPS